MGNIVIIGNILNGWFGRLVLVTPQLVEYRDISGMRGYMEYQVIRVISGIF
jgi:hypothetical protein